MIFHLAIPARDIEESVKFYSQLGQLGRKDTTWAIFNVEGIQLVCHLWPEMPIKPTMYPRHFGFIIDDVAAFDRFYNKCKDNRLPFFEDCFVRFRNEPAEHETFFLKDPSNNVIEFKCYKNKDSIFGI